MTLKQRSKNGHIVINADAIDGLLLLDDNSIDLIFADPPYNIGKVFGEFIDKWQSDEAYVKWCGQWLDIAIRKLKPTGSLYLMSSTQCMPYLDIMIRKKLKVLGRIVWYYDSSGVQAKKHFGSTYEPILFCVCDKKNYTFNVSDITIEAKTGAKRKLIDYRKPVPTPYNTKKVPANVWEFPRVRYRMSEYEEHPTQKPEALLERIILASSNEGDLVVDPFAGSFTTCAVAKKLNRRSVGIDINHNYFKIGLRRLEIANTYNGKPLIKPEKQYKIKNGRSNRSNEDNKQLTLTEDNYA